MSNESMNEYLSNEELMSLIEDIESENLISAPAYLKQQIVAESRKRNVPARMQLVFYSMKVVAAMAAAIILIILMPMTPGDYKTSVLTEAAGQINSISDKVCRQFVDISNILIFKEDNLND